MMNHFRANNFISVHQHGFMSRRSVEGQLVECTDDWSLALDDRKIVDVIYIDFKKAFDSVVHTKLLTKLKSAGIRGKLLDWCGAFLTGRQQRTKIDQSYSPYLDVLSGTGQGTVLGPVFFLVFINDLISEIPDSCTVKLFADDVKLYRTIQNVNCQVILQRSLEILINWASSWQLSVASTKCWVLRLGGDVPSDFNYKIGMDNLEWKTSCRDLGILIDSKLKYHDQCSILAKKANARCALILNCFTSANIKFQTLAFTCYVRPILEYGSVVWNPHFKTDINKIEAVQRRFTKRLLAHTRQAAGLSYDQRLVYLNEHGIPLQKLEFRRVITDLKFCYKILHNLVDVQEGCLKISQHNPARLMVSHCNNIARKNSFCNRVSKLWNASAIEIRQSNSFGTFTIKLIQSDIEALLNRCY